MSMNAPAFVPLGERLNMRQKWLLLITLLSTILLSSLDAQIVATAMPKILADLHGFSLLSWVFTIYMLTSVIAIPLAGKLSDIFGRKPFMIGGILLFVSSSAGVGLSTSMPMLILMRGIQGIGGGTLLACVFALNGDLFTPRERGKYMALFMGVGSFGQISGPSIGGFIADTAGWRWCFIINVPVAMVALMFILAFLPANTSSGRRPKIDFAGAALLTVSSTTLLLALVWGQSEFGWGSVQTVGLFLVAAVACALFIVQERRHPEAILPTHLFRNRQFTMGCLVYAIIGAAQVSATSYLPTFVQAALGASATASGLITTPQAIGTVVSSIIAGQLLARSGRYRVQLFVGLGLLLTVSLLLQTMGVGEPRWHISVYMALFGLSSGVIFTIMGSVIISSVPMQFMGVASSSRQFFQQIASVMSIAIFGVVLSTSYHSAFVAKLPADVKTGLSPAIVAKFDDPTLPIDKRRFGQVQDLARSEPNGEALLASAVDTAHRSVATATQTVFRGGSLIVILALLVAFALPEIPLRASFSSGTEDEKAVEVLTPEPALG